MGNPEPIDYRAHVEWVRSHLLDTETLVLFLVRLGGTALGFTLLKPAGRQIAEAGVMFREASRHPLIPYTVTVMTMDCAFRHLQLDAIVSYILPTNERALATQRSLGGVVVESDRPGMLKFSLEREVCLANQNYLKVLGRVRGKLTVTGRPSVTF